MTTITTTTTTTSTEHEVEEALEEALELDTQSQIFLEMRRQNLDLLKIATQVAGYTGQHGPLKPGDVKTRCAASGTSSPSSIPGSIPRKPRTTRRSPTSTRMTTERRDWLTVRLTGCRAACHAKKQ